MQGKIEKGREILISLAKRNGLPEPDLSNLQAILEKEIKEERNRALKYNYFTLFKYKVTRWRCPLFAFLW